MNQASAQELASRMLSRTPQGDTFKVKFALNFGAFKSVMSYMTALQGLRLQLLCHWFYHYGVSRVQPRLKVNCSVPKAIFWHQFNKGAPVFYALYPKRAATILPEERVLEQDLLKYNAQSCQLGPNKFFQLSIQYTFEEYKNRCRVIDVDYQRKTYAVREVASLEVYRFLPLLVSDGEQFVWAIGGDKCGSQSSKYDSRTDSWDNDSVPRCDDYDRTKAAGCYHKGFIYISGGQSLHDSVYYDTIERLDTRDPAAKWILIDVPNDLRKKTINQVVAPLNDTEIVIFGGEDDYEQSDDDRVRAIILNTETCQVSEAVRDIRPQSHKDSLIVSEDNQSAQVSKNCIMALVSFESDTSSQVCVIGWRKGMPTLIIAKKDL